MNGIVVVDKPQGLSSARVVAQVKRALGGAKVGHTGTLDPFATGVLLCCINQATRLARFMLHGSKCYEAVLHLGVATDTQDGTGRTVAEHPVPDLSLEQLAMVFDRFKGCQMQQPPVYAALKHHGVPLYKLARRGAPVHKPARQVTISSLQIQKVCLPMVRFEVCCSAGTYVRTLGADIGEAVGCGGHLAELRRTDSCGFSIDQAIELDDLKKMSPADLEQALIPMADVLDGMAAIEADPPLLERVAHGRTLTTQHVPGTAIGDCAKDRLADYVKVLDPEGNLRAVLQYASEDERYNYCCVFK